jgi:A/G-specific adenine glycosylase
MKAEFTTNLMQWNETQNKRSMPWKGEKDPFRIWLSEIILQQTRVEQGLSYYNKFIHAFPTVNHLANATEKEVFKLWEGLGYYTRCKNLHATAKVIANKYGGKFPDTYLDIKSLKGIGPYTAAAIASFAFNLPFPVVDGNVQRVISRYFGINTPIDSSAGKKLYLEIADSLLDKENPGKYNQAIMDFGATICKPKNPLCNQCIQNKECEAFLHNWVDQLPVKEKVIRKKERWFTYYLVRYNKQVYIRKRNGKDIWADLYEFILKESAGKTQHQDAITSQVIASIAGIGKFKVKSVSPHYKQQLTHQTIHGQFVILTVSAPLNNTSYQLVAENELHHFPFPKLINSFLTEM